MNTTKVINIIPQSELLGLKAVDGQDEVRQPAKAAATHAWLRRGLIVGIGLVLIAMAFSIRAEINEIEAQNQMICENMMTPIFIWNK